MSAEQTTLDAEESLFLAMNAMGRQDAETVIRHLKHSLALRPDYAQAHFLLGAQYAELGMVDRAMASMGEAVELAPDFDVARFQLGFLYLTVGHPAQAAEVWGPLDALEEDHPMRLFKRGLLALVEDRFVEARELLTAGIERNTVNQSLSQNMSVIVANIDDAMASLPPSDEAGNEAGADGQHLGMSAYQEGSV